MYPYNFQISQGRAAPYDIFTARQEDFSESFDLLHTDLTGKTLKAVVTPAPGGPVVLTLIAAKTQSVKTYQEWIDECLITDAHIPCGSGPSDEMTVTTITLSSAQTSIATLAQSGTYGEPAGFYWSLQTTLPERDLIAAGRFTVTETYL